MFKTTMQKMEVRVLKTRLAMDQQRLALAEKARERKIEREIRTGNREFVKAMKQETLAAEIQNLRTDLELGRLEREHTLTE